MKDELQKILSKFKADKKILIILIIGLTGIILLTLSELFPEKEEEKTEVNTSEVVSTSEYEENLEKRLTSLIASIEGAGNVKVMLTLDCGDESIYASENKQNETSSEKEYVLIKNDGEETGLLLKTAQPEVRGVAVVCEGADSAKVREEITGIVTAVLRLSTNRVNIAKMKSTNGG